MVHLTDDKLTHLVFEWPDVSQVKRRADMNGFVIVDSGNGDCCVMNGDSVVMCGSREACENWIRFTKVSMAYSEDRVAPRQQYGVGDGEG